jgi:putative adenylate-forming enzyme
MELRTLLAILARRRQLRRHERWDRAEVERHQQHALAALRDHAMTRSRFYQRFHRGLEAAPLAALPVLTKTMVMEHFDELVVDPEVQLTHALAHLERDDERLYLDRYVLMTTGGSTGRRGDFLADRDEWITHIASYARAQQWAGVAAGLTHRVRMAVVSSRVPSHASARVGTTAHSRFVPTLRLDATEPLSDNLERLDEFQPDCLVGYASMIHVLAAEQLAGRLHIRPRAVMSASEVLTAETRARAEGAWGSTPYDVYAATETAGIASECARRRKHLYEDLVILEPVDEHHRPVPPGTAGASVLVTVLFSRTQPLIRYEMSDRLALSSHHCGCGIGFALLDRVEGRAEDIVDLPARGGGTVAVHPNVFHRALELVSAAAWQVVIGSDGVRVLLERPEGADLAAIGRAVAAGLARQGVDELDVRAEAVDAIPRTALGKAPLVRRTG